MRRQPIDYLPHVVMLVAAVGLFILMRIALGFTPKGDALAFAGALIGPGLGGLVGYWLIKYEESRRADVQLARVKQAVDLLDTAICRLLVAGQNELPAAQAHEAFVGFRTALRAIDAVAADYSVISVEVVALLEEVKVRSGGLDMAALEQEARRIDGLPKGQAHKLQPGVFNGTVTPLFQPLKHARVAISLIDGTFAAVIQPTSRERRWRGLVRAITGR